MLRSLEEKLIHRTTIADWSPLIEVIFDKLGYEPNVHFKAYEDRYLCYSPLTDDENSMSCTIFTSNGNMKIWNGDVKVVRKEVDVYTSSITISEWCRLLGYMKEYIDFVLYLNNINEGEFSRYASKLGAFVTTDKWPTNSFRESTIYNNFRKKVLMFYYILDEDVLKTITLDRKPVSFESKKIAPKQKAIRLEEHEPTAMQQDIIESYMKRRKIPLIEGVCYPVTVSFSGSGSRRPGVCFKYPNGFTKYRFLFGDKSGRYRTNDFEGTCRYESFFESSVKGIIKDACILIEGEIESLSVGKYTDYDVYALHNTNSLPTCNLPQLASYSTIYVKVDYDSYDTSKDGIIARLAKEFPLTNIVVLPKLISDNKSIDYNMLDVQGVLNSNIIERFSIDKVVEICYNNVSDEIEVKEV